MVRSRQREHGWPVLTVFVCLCLLAPGSRARADDSADARQWFERGISASRAGDFVKAADAFEHSRALSERPSVLQNLAISLQHLGRISEALTFVERAIALSSPRSTAALSRLESLRSELLAQAAEVTFEGTPADASLELDGRPLSAARVRCDPGVHTLRISHPDYEEEKRTLTLEPGARRTEQFSLRARDQAVAAVAPSVDPSLALSTQGAPRREAKFKPWAIVALSAGVAFAGTATTLQLLGHRAENSWQERCKKGDECKDGRLQREQKHVDRLDRASFALFGLAGASAIAATTLFWLHGREQKRPLSVALGPRYLQLRYGF